MKKKKYSLLIVIIFLILVALAALYAIYEVDKKSELDKIYSTFTCNCCDKSLKTSDLICATGIKEHIKEYQKSGLRGQDLFDETVMFLGVNNIIDNKLQESTYKRLNENLPEIRAEIELDENYANLGNVSESKQPFVIKDFKIKNKGLKDLYIFGVETTCSCLSTKFIIEDRESPTMGRFSYPHGLTIKIEPNQEVMLRTTYDARVNSYFRGHEERYVYIFSNDIQTPTNVLKIEVIHND